MDIVISDSYVLLGVLTTIFLFQVTITAPSDGINRNTNSFSHSVIEVHQV